MPTTRVRFIALLAAVVLALTASAPAVAAPPPTTSVIVVLKAGGPSPETAARDAAKAFGGTVGFVYREALRGFSMELPQAALRGLARNPHVAWIEQDKLAFLTQSADEQIMPTGLDRVDADLNPPTMDFGAPGGPQLAILDTGIMAGHPELHPYRYTDCTAAIFYPMFGGCAADGNGYDEDGHGHGTHVAGIAAAKDNGQGIVGAAPNTRLWSVKVLRDDGTGYLGGILAGIDLVTGYAAEIDVANMSLGIQGSSDALDTAITNSVNAGVSYVVAAGNSTADASGFTPASHPDVITVSAVADFDGQPGGNGAPTCRDDQDDTIADFSNFGPAVDIAAPGVCITSTWNDGGYATISGTSMAAPHVAGSLVRYIAENGPFSQDRAGVEAARAGFLSEYTVPASDAAVGFTGGSGEPFLYLGGGATQPPNQPPTASITAPADATTVPSGTPITFTGTGTDTEDGNLTPTLAWTSSLDGSIGTGGSFTTTLSDGTHTITTTATDTAGLTDTDTITVTVDPPPPPNQPPTASITAPADGTTVPSGTPITFTGTGTDTEDGNLTPTLAWTSSLDGSIGTGGSFTTTLSDGTHTITATATDTAGLTDTDTITVTVSAAPGDFSLSVTAYKVRGRHKADLAWSGATSSHVDVYRDGVLVQTTPDDGAYTDHINLRGGAVYEYQVCDSGTTRCSNTALASF